MSKNEYTRLSILDKIGKIIINKPQNMFSLEPQFFDIFGFIGFIYITVLSLLALRGKFIPIWAYIVLFLIGLIGLLVDGLIVYTSYLR